MNTDKEPLSLAIAKKKKKRKLNCKEPGCEQVFFGYPNAKYCVEHKDIKNRAVGQIPKPKIILEDEHFVFPHEVETPTIIEKQCFCTGCYNSYRIEIYPGQKIYPKYCEDHRNKFKRKYFLERKTNA